MEGEIQTKIDGGGRCEHLFLPSLYNIQRWYSSINNLLCSDNTEKLDCEGIDHEFDQHCSNLFLTSSPNFPSYLEFVTKNFVSNSVNSSLKAIPTESEISAALFTVSSL